VASFSTGQLGPFVYALFMIVGFAPSIALTQEDPANYYKIRVGDLEIEGARPEFIESNSNRFAREHMWPYVAMDGGYAYVSRLDRTSDIVVRSMQQGELSGTLFWPKQDWSGMEKFRFRIPAITERDLWRADFYRREKQYFSDLAKSQVAGRYWFAYRVRQAEKVLGAEGSKPTASNQRTMRVDNLALFTGRRAIDENLDLRTRLDPQAESSEETIPLTALRGITVESIDWKTYLPEDDPKLDRLARHVPEDHLAVFFPNLGQAINVLQTSNQFVRPISWSTNSETEDPQFINKYLAQLRIPLDQLAGSELANSIDEIAIVSSDPYWQDGTAVAVLFHTGRAKELERLIVADQRLTTDSKSLLQAQVIGRDVFVVSNSNSLVQQIIRPGGTFLSDLDEYRFFRQRYQKDSEHESAFIVLTDSAIRKWCSPAWRIGQARRRQAAALMAALQSEQLEGVPSKNSIQHEFLGGVTFPDGIVHSEKFGTLAFMRPIAELGMANATTAEVRAYDQWRRQYENQWRRFDPIAIQIQLQENQFETDLTVMPLRAGSIYRRWIQSARQQVLGPSDGDRHADAMVHAIMPSRGMMIFNQADYMEFFLDESPVWQELAQAKDPHEFARSIDYDFPVVVSAQFAEEHLATRFHEMVRTFLGSLTGQNKWTQQSHREIQYEQMLYRMGYQDDADQCNIYMLKHKARVVATLNQKAMHRLIDRMLDDPAIPQLTPWAGDHIGLKITPEAMQILSIINSVPMVERLQERSWSNLPILNEWKRMYPDEDPLEVHQRLWATKLICPAGGEYVWNDTWKSMESTATGHPARPKLPVDPRALLPDFQSLDAGITFEPEGLRGKSIIQLVP